MLWGALRACYGTESEAVAAAARNTGTILPYLNSPSNIKGCYAVLVELLGREQAAEVCAKNPGILQCDPRVLAPERGRQSPARPRLERRRPRPWPSGDAGPWHRAAPSVPFGACRALCAGAAPPPVGGGCSGPRATRLGPTLAEARSTPLPPSQAREQPDALVRAAETARLPLSRRRGRSASHRVWGGRRARARRLADR